MLYLLQTKFLPTGEVRSFRFPSKSAAESALLLATLVVGPDLDSHFKFRIALGTLENEAANDSTAGWEEE